MKNRETAAVQPVAITSDFAQIVDIGSDCWKRVNAAGNDGYQPSKGGPRLLVLTAEREQEHQKATNN